MRVRRWGAAVLGGAVAFSLLIGPGVGSAQEAPATTVEPVPEVGAPTPTEPPLADEPPGAVPRGPVAAKDLPKTRMTAGQVGPAVIDGTPTTTTEYPWMVAILDRTVIDPFQAQFCGGVVVAPEWVLTAAQCVEGKTPGDIRAAIARTNLSDIEYRHQFAEIHIHPSFAYQGPFDDIPVNDVALLKFDNYASPLPTLAYDSIGLDPSGRSETIVGWGAIDVVDPDSTYIFPDQLHHGRVEVVDDSTCEAPTYEAGEFTSATMICAAPSTSATLTDFCPGDTGGPLLAGGPGGYRLLGVASWGYPACGRNPSAYTRVSAFASWIDEVLGAPGDAGTFVPWEAVRMLDTRPGSLNVGSLMQQPLAPGQTVFPQATGLVWGLPRDEVYALVLNVTVTAPTRPGWLTVYPAGRALPTASSLNFVAGQTVANLVTVQLGQGGKIAVNNTGIETGGGAGFDIPAPGAGVVDVIIDLVGYYRDDTTAAYYHPVDPRRVYDSRTAPPVPRGSPDGRLAPRERRRVSVTGGSSPAPYGATAAVLNVTVTNVGEPLVPWVPFSGWLTLYPSSSSVPPAASSLNFRGLDVLANLVTVKVGPGEVASTGDIFIANSWGSSGVVPYLHVVVDVVGYYGSPGDASGGGSIFHAMAPARLLDTRGALAAATPNPSLNSVLGPQATITPVVSGVVGIPAEANAVLVNGTATAPSQYGWFTMFPAWDLPPPFVSNLNFFAGQTVPNAAIVKVGNGSKIGISNSYLNAFSGTTHAVLDVVGWFEP